MMEQPRVIPRKRPDWLRDNPHETATALLELYPDEPTRLDKVNAAITGAQFAVSRYARGSSSPGRKHITDTLELLRIWKYKAEREEQATRERRATIRDKRLALAAKLVRSVVEDDCGEYTDLPLVLPVLEGDTLDVRAIIRADMETGDIDMGDLLAIHSSVLHAKMMNAYERGDYHEMNCLARELAGED